MKKIFLILPLIAALTTHATAQSNILKNQFKQGLTQT